MNGIQRISMACAFFFSLVLFHVSLSYCAGVPITIDDVTIYQYVGSVPYEDPDPNKNGIPDNQEVRDNVDLDRNDIFDNDQDDLKIFKSLVDNSLMGVKGEDGVKGITIAASLETSFIEGQEGKPDSLGEEMICFQVECEKPGEIVFVTLLFEKPVPENAGWIKYNKKDGWYDFSSHTEVSEDRKSVTLELEDGGFGDADQRVDGFIYDPVGYTVFREKESANPTDSVSPESTPPEESSDSSGSGGCFIRMLKKP